MVSYDDIFGISSEAEFERVALAIFHFQAQNCMPYKEYISLLGIDPTEVDSIGKIPFLPISLFKTHKIYCGKGEPEAIFSSSATTGMVRSHHYIADLSLYERTFTTAFEYFYGESKQWSIYALLPTYLERSGSSLIYMVEKLLARCGGGGFYLYDHKKLVADMAADSHKKILLGVTYALLDLAEGLAPKLSNTIVMETGGMKGHRPEIDKTTLHKKLCDAFGVQSIGSEYGMAELNSQAYSAGGNIFEAPKWVKVLIRDINNPFSHFGIGRRGAIDIIDLANIYSCAFIATDDMGQTREDGKFIIEGRITGSDIRGCNLLVQ